MPDTDLTRALAAGADLLAELARDRATPTDALARTAALAEGLDGVRLDLVWEHSDIQGDRHYDLLVRHGGHTASLSVCVATDVPWPLRGVTRWSEKDVVTVNGHLVSVSDAITALDFAWRELDIAGHLVDQALIRQLLIAKAIPGVSLTVGLDGTYEVDGDEVQAAFDDFRRRRGLDSAEALDAWMAVRGLTLEQLEDHARATAARDRLRREVTTSSIGAHFEAHTADYDRVDVLRASPLDQLAIDEIRRDPSRILPVAGRAFLAGTPVDVGYATYFRHQLAPDVAAAMFGAEPGTVVVPFDGEVAQVLRMRPATLDADVRSSVEERLYTSWLAARRSEARIEWLWGDPQVARS